MTSHELFVLCFFWCVLNMCVCICFILCAFVSFCVPLFGVMGCWCKVVNVKTKVVASMSVQRVYTTAAHIPDPRPGLTYVSVSECQLAKYKENPEDKALVEVQRKVLHYTGSSSDDNRLCFN
jgi:hypothetical protein